MHRSSGDIDRKKTKKKKKEKKNHKDIAFQNFTQHLVLLRIKLNTGLAIRKVKRKMMLRRSASILEG